MKRASKPLAEGVLDAVLTESKRQAKALGEMKDALEHDDEQKALEKAREVCGLEVSKNPSPKSSR